MGEDEKLTDKQWFIKSAIDLMKTIYKPCEDADGKGVVKLSKSELIENLSEHFGEKEIFESLEFYKALRDAGFIDLAFAGDEGPYFKWLFSVV